MGKENSLWSGYSDPGGGEPSFIISLDSYMPYLLAGGASINLSKVSRGRLLITKRFDMNMTMLPLGARPSSLSLGSN